MLTTITGIVTQVRMNSTRQELPLVSLRAFVQVAPCASTAIAGNRMARRSTTMMMKTRRTIATRTPITLIAKFSLSDGNTEKTRLGTSSSMLTSTAKPTKRR